MMLACSVAFILLNYLGVARKFYSSVRTTNDENACYYNSVEMQLSSDSAIGQGSAVGQDCTVGHEPTSVQPSETEKNTDEKSERIATVEKSLVLTDIDKPVENTSDSNRELAVRLIRKDYIYLLTIIGFINALSNGVLPAVSSYTSLPYGPKAYHLAATLGNMAYPVAWFIAGCFCL